jgi:DNA ligase 1
LQEFNLFPLAAYFVNNQPYEYVKVVDKEECVGTQHMERRYQEIIEGGGEGIILRDPNAAYQPGRSLGYLKHKVFGIQYLSEEV